MRFCCFYFPLFLFKLDFMLKTLNLSSAVCILFLSMVAGNRGGEGGDSREWSPNPNSLYNLQRRRLVLIYYVYRVEETFDLLKWRLQILDLNQRSPTRLALHTSTMLVKKRNKRLFWKKENLKILSNKKDTKASTPLNCYVILVYIPYVHYASLL